MPTPLSYFREIPKETAMAFGLIRLSAMALTAFAIASTYNSGTAWAGDEETINYTGFETPSGNINCTALVRNEVAELVSCTIIEFDRDTIGNGCGNGEWNFEVERAGRGNQECVTDSYGLFPRPQLGYGSTWQLEGFNCEIEKSGVTCKNSQGHGFSLSRIEQRVF
jgi:hypothetical protein